MSNENNIETPVGKKKEQIIPSEKVCETILNMLKKYIYKQDLSVTVDAINSRFLKAFGSFSDWNVGKISLRVRKTYHPVIELCFKMGYVNDDEEKSNTFFKKCFELIEISIISDHNFIQTELLELINEYYVSLKLKQLKKDEAKENLKFVFDSIKQDDRLDQLHLACLFDYKAMILTRLEQFNEALKPEKKCLTIYRNKKATSCETSSQFIIGIIHQKIGNFDMALKAFEKIQEQQLTQYLRREIVFDHENIHCFYYIGKLLFMKKCYKDAIEKLELFVDNYIEDGDENDTKSFSIRKNNVQVKWARMIGDSTCQLEDAKEILLEAKLLMRLKGMS